MVDEMMLEQISVRDSSLLPVNASYLPVTEVCHILIATLTRYNVLSL
jgi:hypothetical protein